jgi:hypothetical protein
VTGLSPADDLPIHQTAEVVRHPVTGDRNFYDRYYFNCHASGDPSLFLVFGLGQYPNLGVTDAFAAVARDGRQHVVRASRELGVNRLDTTVGPFRVEVLEGLRRLRCVLEPTEHHVAFDLTWDASVPAVMEPRHFIRVRERVVFDSSRFAQTGTWSGSLVVDGTSYDVTPGRWGGCRDRSWGVRPVGEPESPGIHGAKAPGTFFWVYAPLQFPDFSVVVIAQEEADGTRVLEEAVRVPRDGEPVPLGTPTIALTFVPGTREVASAVLSFPDGPDIEVECVLPLPLGAGTGYGGLDNWRHGQYQGELVVQGASYDVSTAEVRASYWNVMDTLARVRCDGVDGWGMFEFACFGPHAPSGFQEWTDGAPL